MLSEFLLCLVISLDMIFLMKKFLSITILISCLMLPSQADDIRDFQIEGISIGDSALKYFSEELIKNSTAQIPGNHNNEYEWATIYDGTKISGYRNLSDFAYTTFDTIEFTFKKNDKNFIIEGISGGITNTFKKNIKNIEDCKKQKNKMYQEVKSIFKSSISRSDNGSVPFDKTGKSKYFRSAIQISEKSKWMEIEVTCVFYEGEITKDFTTSVGPTIKSDKLNDWFAGIYK